MSVILSAAYIEKSRTLTAVTQTAPLQNIVTLILNIYDLTELFRDHI